MNVKSKIKCECGSLVEVKFKKPHAIESTFGVKECDDCGSRIKFRAFKTKGAQNQVNFNVSIKPSDELLLMKIEEMNEANK